MLDPHALIMAVLFFGVFLAFIALLRSITEKIHFPYTVALLNFGFIAQILLEFFHVPVHLSLSTDVVYYILLPLLLFESASQINAHQFKLQFKTITFLATIGLLFSIFTIAAGLFYIVGLPLAESMLFAALISATDPIAVLALFKSLGAPKRLGLLAEGESMLNDATGVIAFRVISAFVIAQTQFQTVSLAFSLFDFVRVFVGSIVLGGILGYITAQFIAQVKNDRLIEITLMVALALFSFAGAEHFFHLSGVITTVVAALVLGNVGRTKISGSVIHFMHEFWEYIGFICVSLVFFFAAFNTDLRFIFEETGLLLTVVLIVLVGRAVSVYGSFLVTNHTTFFKDEPNVPLRWQHILNWGGLRGVIPLVLVYSLPEEFYLRQLFIDLTLANFLFTLFINATTIEWVLKKLKLHVPEKEEQIIQRENDIFAIEAAKQRVSTLPKEEFDQSVIQEVLHQLRKKEYALRQNLGEVTTLKEFKNSLLLEAINIERAKLQELFGQGHISESVLYEFDGELDLQQDAIEHPDVYTGRGYRDGGMLNSQEQFRMRVEGWKNRVAAFPFLGFLHSEENLVFERFALLQARIVCSTSVIDYLTHVSELLNDNPRLVEVIREVQDEHEKLRLKNSLQMEAVKRDYQRLYQNFELKLVESYAWAETNSH